MGLGSLGYTDLVFGFRFWVNAMRTCKENKEYDDDEEA